MPQVESAPRVQAEQPEPVGRQTAAIAGRAEGLGRRRDDPEGRAVGQPEAFGRRGVATSGASRSRRSGRSDAPASRVAAPPCRTTSCVAPPTSMYSMKRTSAPTRRPNVEQVVDLIVVDAAHDDRVDLERVESGRRRRLDAREHGWQRVEPRDRLEALAAQGVEADGEAVQPGVAELRAPSGPSSTPLVVSARSRIAGCAASSATSSRQVPPQERLAAGQAHAIHAERRERVGRPSRSRRSRAGSRAAATRSRAPACNTGSGGCSGR